MRSSPTTAAGLALLLASCSSESLSVSVELHELTPKELVLDVKTAPGVRVGRSYGEAAQKGPLTAEDGTARISVPRSDWQHLSTLSLEVHANGDGMGRKRYGQGKVTFPFNVQKLVLVAEGEPLYFSYLEGVELKWQEKVSVKIVGPGAPKGPPVPKGALDRETYWLPKEKVFELWFAAPAGAAVKVASAEVNAGKGFAKAAIPSDELALLADMATVHEKSVTLSIPVEVTKDGQNKRHTLALRAESRNGEAWWLAERIDGVESGKPFPTGATVPALLFRSTSREVLHFGAGGTAFQARWVSIAHGTVRDVDSKKRPCPLHNYEDSVVTVLDAQSGKKLASKSFTAADARCEGMLVQGAGKVVYGPDEKAMTAWLEAGMAKEWR